jgi:hypothetical protein
MSKMMLEKEWSCNLRLAMIFYNQFIPLSINYTKGGTQITTSMGGSLHVDFKWAWIGKILEFLALIAFNNNG